MTNIMLLVLLILCVTLLVNSSKTITVGKISDDTFAASNCAAPNPSTSCSLRSAWEYCLITERQNCTIVLPENGFLLLNSSFGSLELTVNTSITILGNNAVIMGSNELNAISYYQNESSLAGFDSVPQLNIDRLTFQGFGNTGENGGNVY